VLPGATVTGYNPEVFERSAVVMGFELEVPAGDRDRLGRPRLELGEPVGVSALLEHAAVTLHEEDRGSAVHLPAALKSTVEIHLDLGDLEVVHVPESVTVGNASGRLELTAASRKGSISVIRDLNLDRASYSPGQWLELRALLLADGNVRHRTVLLR